MDMFSQFYPQLEQQSWKNNQSPFKHCSPPLFSQVSLACFFVIHSYTLRSSFRNVLAYHSRSSFHQRRQGNHPSVVEQRCRSHRARGLSWCIQSSDRVHQERKLHRNNRRCFHWYRSRLHGLGCRPIHPSASCYRVRFGWVCHTNRK